mmetsp:Transcript_4970/g.13378  ORF Transcript_4970/g.13378 Transcript_4970/m.13378 type:complete len:121 (+) Transcript_4970:281-643(+)
MMTLGVASCVGTGVVEGKSLGFAEGVALGVATKVATGVTLGFAGGAELGVASAVALGGTLGEVDGDPGGGAVAERPQEDALSHMHPNALQNEGHSLALNNPETPPTKAPLRSTSTSEESP